jgi:hypothetical protein
MKTRLSFAFGERERVMAGKPRLAAAAAPLARNCRREVREELMVRR